MNFPIPAGVLFLYYGVTILSLIVAYTTGWLIKRYLFGTKDDVSALSILTCSVLGITSVVTVYSIVSTKGITVNWILLLLLLIYRVSMKKETAVINNIQPYSSPVWKYLLTVCIINAIFFCYFICRITDFEHGMFQIYYGDFNYYAKLSQYLNLGYENLQFEYNFFKSVAPQPYHYFEIWINAVMYKTFGLNALITYSASLPMLFNTLLFIAFLAVIELRTKITAGYVAGAFVILLLSDVITYLSMVFPQFKGGEMPLLETPKLLSVFLFLLTSIVLFLYGRKREAYYALIIIPVLNIISLVSVWGTTGVLLLADTIKKRKINLKYWLPFASAALLYFIYVLWGGWRSIRGWNEPFHWGLLRLYFTQPIVYSIAYIHIIILIFVLNKKEVWSIMKKICTVVSVSFFISMTVSIFMRPYHYDAIQFARPVTVLVYAIVATTFLISVTSVRLTAKKKGLTALFCGISLLMSINAYNNNLTTKSESSSEYESAVLRQLRPSQNEYRIGFYMGENSWLVKDGIYTPGIVDVVTIPDVLDYYHNNVYHYPVNKGDYESQHVADHTPFRDYYEKRKERLPTVSDDDIRMDFMKENAVEYLRIFNTATPTDYFLSNLILLAEDKLSGERFYKVR
jgi:hypothetical protein